MASTVGSGQGSSRDFIWFHPQNTTVDGLVEIADNVIKKNLLIDDKAVTCMAKNIFFEAAVESTAGKLAVAQVTLNRVESKHYPNTVCEVVYEGPHYTASDGQLLPKRASETCFSKTQSCPTRARASALVPSAFP